MSGEALFPARVPRGSRADVEVARVDGAGIHEAGRGEAQGKVQGEAMATSGAPWVRRLQPRWRGTTGGRPDADPGAPPLRRAARDRARLGDARLGSGRSASDRTRLVGRHGACSARASEAVMSLDDPLTCAMAHGARASHATVRAPHKPGAGHALPPPAPPPPRPASRGGRS